MPNLLEQLNSETATVVEGVRRSLVAVHNGKGGVGSGIVWDPNGLIITNAHVIGQGLLKVTSQDGSVLPARTLGYDPDYDLAALAVEATTLPAVEVGDSMQLRPGHWVFALGHPWGVAGAVTAGVVAAVRPETLTMPSAGREWITVSLRLRPGNSGGPLVDVDGRLVGVNTMTVGPDLGLALPVHVVKDFLAGAVTLSDDRLHTSTVG